MKSDSAIKQAIEFLGMVESHRCIVFSAVSCVIAWNKQTKSTTLCKQVREKMEETAAEAEDFNCLHSFHCEGGEDAEEYVAGKSF